jgi:hypothetical protein
VVRALSLGTLAVGLAALPDRIFELDRFFVPKEIALHVGAAAALFVAWSPAGAADRFARPGDRPPDGIDLALGLFVVASAASGLLAASGWLATHAVAVTAAGAALFWAARAAAARGGTTAVLRAVAILPAIAVATALAQAYGAHSDYFSLNRARAAPSATGTSSRTCAPSGCRCSPISPSAPAGAVRRWARRRPSRPRPPPSSSPGVAARGSPRWRPPSRSPSGSCARLPPAAPGGLSRRWVIAP